ncbi:MAG: ATP-binding protein [Methanosarcinaceae archaeon]|nr:ATP-binding protein [Methanosarcinaceae archaeon]
MRKDESIAVLSRWNFWTNIPETGKERSQLQQALKYLKSKANKVVVISGVRRSGKTVLTRQIVKKLIEERHDAKSTLIINFEEPSFSEELDLKHLQSTYDAYIEIIQPSMQPVVILDEIQEIPKWEKFVRSLQERNEARIIVTGSSSALMSGEFSTVLTGRTLEINMFPLSFREFLNFSGMELGTPLDMILKKDEIIRNLKVYEESGGFPEVVIEIDDELKFAILRKIYEDILFKDIVKRWSVRNIDKLEFLGTYYLTNISSPITFNKISKFLKMPVKTVETYSKYLEASNLIFFIKRFSFSLKEQENSPRKVYSIDTGLANSAGFRFQTNYGKFVENTVATQLLRKTSEDPFTDVYYWKDYQHREVDFVVKDGLRVKQLIQVCYDIEDLGTKERELEAIVRASKELECDNLLVITWDYEGEEDFKGKMIEYIPLWKWLLKGFASQAPQVPQDQ